MKQLERLGKGTLVYGVGGLLNRFISFLLLPLFTTYLTPTDYGISSMLSLVAFFVTPVFSLGFGAALAPCYFEGNNMERKETTIWTAFMLLVSSTFFLAIVAIFFAQPISQLAFQTPEYHYLVTLSICGTCLSILATPFMLYLQFEEQAKLFVALTVMTMLVSISLSLLMVVILRRGVQGMIEAGLIAQGINLTLFSMSTISRIKFRFSLPLSKELLQLGIPMIPSFAFLFVMQASDRYILQWFEGLEIVGVYTVGYNLGLLMNLFVSAFQNAWVPYFMSFVDKRDEARALFGQILTYYVLGFGVLNLVFFIVAKPAVMLMTQPAFYEAYKVVGLSAGAQFFIGLFSILLPGIYFAKEVKYVSLVQAVTALIAIGFNLLFIPLLGLLGAAIALMFSFLAMAVLMQLWNLKRKDSYLEVKYEWNRIRWFVLIYLGCAVFTLWERSLPWFTEVTLSLILLIFLPIMLYAFLNSYERQYLWVIAKYFIPKRFKHQYTKV